MSLRPYYDDGNGTVIYLGDCREILPKLPKVDLVFTSPPYNKGCRVTGNRLERLSVACKGVRFRSGYGLCTDDMTMAEYEEWQREIIAAIWERLTDSGALFYNHKPRIMDARLWTPLQISPLPVRQIITWHTGTGINLMPGAFAPACEWILVFAKENWEIGKTASAAGDVWSVPPAHNPEHPAPFPISLPSRAIALTNAQTILDPFAGSGTTLRAAKDLGRKSIGIEINEAYCEIAAKRLSQSVFQFSHSQTNSTDNPPIEQSLL